MDIAKLEGIYYGVEFRNRYEIFEHLIVAIFSAFAQVRVEEDNDEFTKLEVKIDDQIFHPVLFYLGEFLILAIGELNINLRVGFFVKEFTRKRYVANDKNEFVELVNKSSLKRLLFILRRTFIRQNCGMEKLPKVLVAEILSFLDCNSLSNVLLTCHDMKKLCSYQDIWRDMYYARYGKCDFNLKELKWKKIYIDSQNV